MSNPDPARLAHHADAAGDAQAVLRCAPEAAARASALGAHREAAAQYARALRFAEGLPAEMHAALIERRGNECFLTERFESASEELERAVELQRKLGNRVREGNALRMLSRVHWCTGRIADSADAARRAVALLEQYRRCRGHGPLGTTGA
jgi:hypothetical protein